MIIDLNEITDVIDMTNTSCGTDHDIKIEEYIPKDVRLFTPVFTTPLDLKRFRESR